jgi:hypothetical protein
MKDEIEDIDGVFFLIFAAASCVLWYPDITREWWLSLVESTGKEALSVVLSALAIASMATEIWYETKNIYLKSTINIMAIVGTSFFLAKMVLFLQWLND